MTGSAHEVHDDHDRTRFVLGHAGSTAALAYGNEHAVGGIDIDAAMPPTGQRAHG